MKRKADTRKWYELPENRHPSRLDAGIPENAPCDNCGARPAVSKYAGQQNMNDLNHYWGWEAWWCMICILQAQLAHAEDAAALIPELKRQLREATGDSSETD